MGHAGEPEHGVEPQQEDLRQDRGLAEPPHRRRDVPLSRRHRDEADVGRRGAQRLAAGGQRGDSKGFREILGICEGAKEDKSGWPASLRHLVDRGLKGVQVTVSDACRGLMESAAEYLPDARWQRCMVHFYRNVFSHVPATRVREVSHMLKAIHAQENRDAADRKARAIVEDLRAARMNTAADLVERSVHETLTYYAFPDIHWQKIRTDNPLERIMKRFGGAPASSAHSPTANHASIWRQLDYATSLAPHGPPSAT